MGRKKVLRLVSNEVNACGAGPPLRANSVSYNRGTVYLHGKVRRVTLKTLPRTSASGWKLLAAGTQQMGGGAGRARTSHEI